MDMVDEPRTSLSGNVLTIKTQTCSVSASSNLKSSTEPSPLSSPLVSPPSSAFFSALQSPYISPRATTPNPTPVSSNHGSQSDDVPSSSYTPPSDLYEFSDENPADLKLKYVTGVPVSNPTPPRISFSFPVPRISFKGGPVSSPAANAKLRSCDVFIGFHGQNPNLARFCKWFKSELEIQGIACFVADRAKYSDNQSHEIADRIICSVTYGVVVVTNSSFINHLSMEEIRFFAQKKNLIPIFFDTGPAEVTSLLNCNSTDKVCKEAIDGLVKCHEFKLEANGGNLRTCVTRASGILKMKLGRKSVIENDSESSEEIPFPRNKYFLGREKELNEMETAFFGYGDCPEQDHAIPVMKGDGSGQSEGFADEESDNVSVKGGRFINLELGKCKEPTFKRAKYKKSKTGSNKSVVCINAIAGVGKTELVLEFAYRSSQRYKMVLWVGGESRYFKQNILNLAANLGLDVSADPYLLIIDNLEMETDLHDLIPRNTGGTHVIITTRLSKVMNIEIMQLPTLALSDAIVLARGKRRKDYPDSELEFLIRFEEKLARLSFGLWVVGCLLSEFEILPSVVFEAVNGVTLEDVQSPYMSNAEEQFCKNNLFLMKLLCFCFAVLQQMSGRRKMLASRMLLVGAWFAPSPISASLLAASAKNMDFAGKRFRNWTKGLFCCGGCGLAPQSEEESSLLLVKLGLARKSNQQPGCWIQFHPITQIFAKRRDGLLSTKATVQGIKKIGTENSDHLWASAFLVFGFKSEPPLVQLKPIDMVLYIKKTALPLAIKAFTDFSRCNSALELLKVCTNVLEEVEKTFVSQIQDWRHSSLCWKKKTNQRVDEYVWQEVTLLKATLLETRAKLLLRGGCFDSGEELCRTCISIRTVMLGHNHAQTLAAQETLAKLVRMRSKI